MKLIKFIKKKWNLWISVYKQKVVWEILIRKKSYHGICLIWMWHDEPALSEIFVSTVKKNPAFLPSLIENWNTQARKRIAHLFFLHRRKLCRKRQKRGLHEKSWTFLNWRLVSLHKHIHRKYFFHWSISTIKPYQIAKSVKCRKLKHWPCLLC